jgi:AraC-like DNA-binding protein
VITQIAGARRYRQNGAEVLLKPGDSTVIDSGRPWSSSCGTDCVRLYLRVPRWMMENRLRTVEIPIAQRICGSAGMEATLARLSQSLYEEAEWMKEQESAAVLDAYFEILAACIGGSQVNGHSFLELRGRIYQFVDAHISEPTLGPVEIATALGISVRHLHRLCSVAGKTLGEYIRARRLEQCRDDLANPHVREKTITEIAFCWGFSDSAHFSHCFRKQFGISPRAFRAQTTTSGRNIIKDERVRDFLRTEAPALRYSRPN